jgi:endonuclease/exonuclease/phosphatase (EEP) superfamily protein YafD
MHVLSSPIHYIKSRRAYKKQKRTALHILAVSGVVRPGHVELRYAAPIGSITAFRSQPAAITHPQTQAVPSQPDTNNVTLNFKQARQWTRTFSSVIVQLANKPVTLPWTKQLDM